jgi:hypothetical protein
MMCGDYEIHIVQGGSYAQKLTCQAAEHCLKLVHIGLDSW